MTANGQATTCKIEGVLSYRTALGEMEAYVPRSGYEPMTAMFYTFEALQTTLGRKHESGRNGIAGWSLAASACSKLVRAHQRDNPYADLMLLQIEQNLVEHRAVVSKVAETVQKKLDSLRGIATGQWGDPYICVAIDSGSAHGRMLALFAIEIDQLFVSIRQAHSLGLMTGSELGAAFRRCRRYLRQALGEPVTLYSKLCIDRELVEVTRQDFVDGSDALELLRARLGVDPSREIMAKQLQPDHVPVNWAQHIVSGSSDTHTINDTGEEATTP